MPVHTHDCDACRYLGTAILMGQTWDFYSCVGDLTGGSIICRYGSDGPEYSSCPISIARDLLKEHPVYRYGLSLL